VYASRVAYVADQVVDGTFAVFSVPLDLSSPPIKLDAGLPASSQGGFWFAPGDTVLFSKRFQSSFFDRLFRAPIDGSSPPLEIATSGVPVPPDDSTFIGRVSFTEDGTRAFFEGRSFDTFAETHTVRLFQVPVNGSQAASALFTPGIVHLQESGDLFSVAADGSTQAVQLNPTGTTASSPVISHDGKRAVYVEGGFPSKDVISVKSDGTQRVQLDPPGTTAGPPRISPDGTRVVFPPGGSHCVAPIDGSSAATVIAGPGVNDSFAEFEFLPDPSKVTVVIETGTFRGLFVVPIDGSTAPVLLNGPPQPERGVALPILLSFNAFVPEKLFAFVGGRVLYRQDRTTDESFELYGVRLDASEPEVRLCPPLGVGRNVEQFVLVPGGQRVAYRSDQANNDTFEAFSVPVDGSADPVRLNSSLPSGPVVGDVLSFQAPALVGPESRVVFRADADADQFFQLYSARLHGPPEVRLISGPGDVGDFARSAAGNRIVYSNGDKNSLFSTRANGLGPVIQLDQRLSFPFP